MFKNLILIIVSSFLGVIMWSMVNASGVSVNRLSNIIQSSSGSVSHGETNPANILGFFHIKNGDSGVPSLNVLADDFFIESDGNTGMSIGACSSCAASIYFASTGGGEDDIGRIDYFNASERMGFSTNGNRQMTLDGSGNIGLSGITDFSNGTRVLEIDADGTVPTSSPAGQIQIFADDSTDGATNATLAMRLEQAVEVIGTFTPSHKLKIWINGVEYLIQLDAVL